MRVRLARIKKTKAGMHWADSRKDKLVRIYSDQWGCYWGVNRSGYTENKEDAGVYIFSDALDASAHCGPEKGIIYEFIDDGVVTQESRGKANPLLSLQE